MIYFNNELRQFSISREELKRKRLEARAKWHENMAEKFNEKAIGGQDKVILNPESGFRRASGYNADVHARIANRYRRKIDKLNK